MEPMHSPEALDPALQSRITTILNDHDVVIFMKGTAIQPVCGFSAVVVNIFKTLGVNFFDINVLAETDMRDGIKIYNNWPTIPQVFIKGEFIGGCDITRAMYQNGELQSKLTEAGILAAGG